MFTFKFRHHKLIECSYHGNVLSKRRSEEPVEFYVLVGQNFLENKKKQKSVKTEKKHQLHGRLTARKGRKNELLLFQTNY